jgi:hypothetical protein
MAQVAQVKMVMLRFWRGRAYGEGMNDKLSRGDEVTWATHGTETEGTVEKKITSDTDAAGRTVRASSDDPQYLVKSAKSGREAVHKPEALTKKNSAEKAEKKD